MNKLVSFVGLCLLMLLVAAPAMAEKEGDAKSTDPAAEQGDGDQAEVKAEAATQVFTGKAVGVGLVILGAGFGISKIGAAAVESQARQPEVAGAIQTAMIISAALIEGVTLFALIVCMQA